MGYRYPPIRYRYPNIYCIEDEYLSKHDTSTHYVGLDEFDVDASTAYSRPADGSSK